MILMEKHTSNYYLQRRAQKHHMQKECDCKFTQQWRNIQFFIRKKKKKLILYIFFFVLLFFMSGFYSHQVSIAHRLFKERFSELGGRKIRKPMRLHSKESHNILCPPNVRIIEVVTTWPCIGIPWVCWNSHMKKRSQERFSFTHRSTIWNRKVC